MKKICTVVGARPQFIKLAVVSRVLRKEFDEVIIHTGQHYDHNMSDVFFEEMDIPKPDYNLGISGGTHGQMTGQMLIKVDEILLKERPDMLLVFGDTNSTLAGALAAVKLHIPVCHVEAGNRLGTYENPEEVNRIVTDHISSLHLVCTASGVDFLKREGFSDSIHLVGDPMYDAFCYYSARLDGSELNELTGFDGAHIDLPDSFYYMTCHRQENTDTDEKLDQIFQAMDSLDAPTIYPVHPRNQERAARLCQAGKYQNIILTLPVGYQTSISLVNHAKKIVTDSGGLQREAFFAQKPCVTVFDWVTWPETMVNFCNQLAKPDRTDILAKLNTEVCFEPKYRPFGDGNSAEKIVKHIRDYLN
ncbi:MAG: UDP-N-acetylglucosamine 2-epimerase (non-hydrolyzing) [Oscillospiraceae bacterium]|nr:UDP-N-acetylglucosamine 2-epimerase (non-hydrolyzing) [Oscillospiraceae bacterium]MDE7172635.1 UDP-N-acetylglucosamine 2-epimerase (non-hydrolyzing) [Oscillospiraceae bacterium]